MDQCIVPVFDYVVPSSTIGVKLLSGLPSFTLNANTRLELRIHTVNLPVRACRPFSAACLVVLAANVGAVLNLS